MSGPDFPVTPAGITQTFYRKHSEKTHGETFSLNNSCIKVKQKYLDLINES